MKKIILKEQTERVDSQHEQFEMILDGCRLNEGAAQRQLYNRYYRYAMSIAFRYTSDYDNAVEMVNDGFFKIFRELKKFAPRNENTAASFMAWFKQVIIFACIDHLRKYNKKEGRVIVEPAKVAIEDTCKNAVGILQHKDIIHCIQQLSPVYKMVFDLYAIEGYSHAEIANKLNISEGTSKVIFIKQG
ncbi:MAG: polymerase sigma factor [Ferruginibacter sp.]|uniref:RNA polymerase sigma factor n=1 Tax=Ferruginibacter sp. TaxID=1940288 RepID=UPI002658AE24|nr:RNA polymerase sigma factor [Ferruginibacter sp.]MDB5276615.1 polymerase sigma factor [Ferruginibacter sp.]